MMMVMKKVASDFPSIQQLTRKRCFALHRLSGRTAFSGIVVSPGIFGNNPTRHCFHDASLVNFTPSRCSCGPDNSTDIWLMWSTPMLVFTLRAYGSLSAWRIRPSATSRLALDAIHASSCKSPQWRAQMRRQVPDGQARAVAYVRYLPVHVLIDHSLDTSDVRARQH